MPKLTNDEVRRIVLQEFDEPDALDDCDTILDHAVKAAITVRDSEAVEVSDGPK